MLRSSRIVKVLSTALLVLLIAAPAWAQLPEKFVVRPEGMPTGATPWSPAVLVGSTLYLAGHGGVGPGSPRPAAFEEEARLAFGALGRTLAAAGMDAGNVVSLYVYLSAIGDVAAFEKVLRDQYPSNLPARSIVGVGRLPGGARVQLQAIAVQDAVPRIYHGAPATSAVAVNGIVYLSGVAPGVQAANTRLAIKGALAGLGSVLRSAGLDYRHVVFCNPYLAPAVPRADLDVVYRQFFEFGNTPARATLDMNALPGGAPIALSAVAVADLERRRVVRPISRELSPTASPAVFAGDALYLSGFSGFMPGYGTLSEDFDLQLRFALRNVQDCLESAGLAFDNIVSLNCYLGNLDDSERMLRLFREYFPKNPPALTILQQSPTGPNNRPAVQFSGIAVRSVTAAAQ